MAVVRASVHLAAGDHVDAGDLLIENGRLAGAKLRVRHRRHGELTDRKQPIQRLEPVRHAVRADHRRGVFRVSAHHPQLRRLDRQLIHGARRLCDTKPLLCQAFE